MPITSSDVTAPTGELQASWFSTPDLPTAAGIWIALGASKVPDGATQEQADAVVLAYTYWRGFSDVLLRMASDPNSVSIDKGDISAAYAADQRKYFAQKVAEWKAAFTDAVEDATAVTVEADTPPRASFAQQIVRSF